jgi:hypothetical protein
MTQPASTAPDPQDDLALRPADILAHLIVTLLAPMFLMATNGDLSFAQLAAFETLNAYRAKNQVDLIAIAQIVCCGLAALVSISRSMEDDISVSMTLRLRGNAVALNRTVEHARRALEHSRRDPETAAPDPADLQEEARVLSSVADTRKRVEEANARVQTQKPPPGPGRDAEPRRQATWAAAMSQVADEFTASLPHLSPGERKIASIRASALSSCANHLLSGGTAPDDVAAMMRPKLG